MEQKSVKELLEVLEALQLLGVAAKKIMKDGQPTVGDIPVLVDLAMESKKIVAAIEGAGEIPAEVKDISVLEAKEVLEKLIAVAAAIKAA